MARAQHFCDACGSRAVPAAMKWHADLVLDLTALRAAIVGITAKLDADGGVTDTNYGSLWNPAALRTTD